MLAMPGAALFALSLTVGPLRRRSTASYGRFTELVRPLEVGFRDRVQRGTC